MTLTGKVATGERRMNDVGQSRSEVMSSLGRKTRDNLSSDKFWSKVQSEIPRNVQNIRTTPMKEQRRNRSEYKIKPWSFETEKNNILVNFMNLYVVCNIIVNIWWNITYFTLIIWSFSFSIMNPNFDVIAWLLRQHWPKQNVCKKNLFQKGSNSNNFMNWSHNLIQNASERAYRTPPEASRSPPRPRGEGAEEGSPWAEGEIDWRRRNQSRDLQWGSFEKWSLIPSHWQVRAKKARKLRGIKAKRYNKERFSEKVQLRKKFKAFEEKGTEITVDRYERSNFLMTWPIWQIWTESLLNLTTGRMRGQFRHTCWIERTSRRERRYRRK